MPWKVDEMPVRILEELCLMPSEHCLRCQTVELTILPESNDQIAFYECPSCRRHFARRPCRALCDGWLSPISLVLYGIQFELNPRAGYLRVAQTFLRERSREEIAGMIEEIERELKEPTQNVRDILDLRHGEKELRSFLRLVVDHWKEAL